MKVCGEAEKRDEQRDPWYVEGERDRLLPCNVGDGEELIISMLSEPQRVLLLLVDPLLMIDLALV